MRGDFDEDEDPDFDPDETTDICADCGKAIADEDVCGVWWSSDVLRLL